MMAGIFFISYKSQKLTKNFQESKNHFQNLFHTASFSFGIQKQTVALWRKPRGQNRLPLWQRQYQYIRKPLWMIMKNQKVLWRPPEVLINGAAPGLSQFSAVKNFFTGILTKENIIS